MNGLALLAITVVGFGGPAKLRGKTFEIPNASITVSQGIRAVVQTDKVGNIAVRLKPGVYVLHSFLTEGGGPCQTKTVRVGHRKRSVTLGCLIK